jgi:lipoprotein|nr:MAG TPA: TRAF PROTEIN, TRAO PROTEIN, TRAN ADHESION, BACTERIAL SECRETION.5A [Bacteriophage sp.]
MKKLLLIVTGLMLTACGDDIVSIDDRGVLFFGNLDIQELSKNKQFSYASIMLSDTQGMGDLKSIDLNIVGEKSESKCLRDTEILINNKRLQPITVKLEERREKELSYRAKYSFSAYLEFFAKNNKVMISSCGINHVLTEDEKGGLARIARAWLKFTDKKL